VQKNQASATVLPQGVAFSSKSFVWLKGAFVCGLALLLVGGMFMVSRISHALQFSAGGNEATVRTAAGDWRVERPSEVGPGLPVYPDSLLVLPERGSAPTAPKNNQVEVYSSIYYSTDSSDFVDDWYLKHLSPEFTRSNSPDDAGIAGILSDANISNSHISFVGERGDQVRIVAITSDSAGTKIALIRSTKHSTP
jgi:hypothetical protein